MVRAGAGHVDDAAPAREFRGQDRAAAARRGPAEDFPIDRVTVGADAEALPDVVADALVALGRHQRGDVVGVVEARELPRRRLRAVAIAILVEPAQRPDQVERGRHARDGERVLRPVGRAAVDLGADEPGPHSAHVGLARRLAKMGYPRCGMPSGVTVFTRLASSASYSW